MYLKEKTNMGNTESLGNLAIYKGFQMFGLSHLGNVLYFKGFH